MISKADESVLSKSFFTENKTLIIGGVFLIAVVIIAAFMFTSSPDRLVGQFTKTAKYENVVVNFHGLDDACLQQRLCVRDSGLRV